MALGLAKVSLSQVRLALSSLPLLKALDVVDGDLSPPLPFPCEGLLGLGCTSGLNGEAAGTALEGMMCPRCAKATGTDYPFRDLAQAYALLPPGPAAPPPPQFKTSIRLGPLPALPAGEKWARHEGAEGRKGYARVKEGGEEEAKESWKGEGGGVGLER